MHYFIAFELYRAHLAEWDRKQALREQARPTKHRGWTFPRWSLTTRRRRARITARAAAGAHACR